MRRHSVALGRGCHIVAEDGSKIIIVALAGFIHLAFKRNFNGSAKRFLLFNDWRPDKLSHIRGFIVVKNRRDALYESRQEALGKWQHYKL